MRYSDAQCRFEDRLAGRALVMHHARDCITASAAAELNDAFARIQAAQAEGYWIALLLDYELGGWLDPALAEDAAKTDGNAAHAPTGGTILTPPPPTSNATSNAATDAPPLPRLTAWVFTHAEHTTPWSAPAHRPRLHSELGITTAAYHDAIAALRTGMARGDFYQANYTFPIHATVHGSLQTLYRAIANAHPSAHAVWFQDARRSILSFSPELFVARTGDLLTVRPMKGTAPRDADPMQDQRNADALTSSAKDRAENLMIVDLLRNDLGRIATPGSVKVASLFQLECYPSVWTLTSTITAQAPQRSLQDVLRALFPCGSITGAPKIAAMQALRRLEPQPRGIYCGSLGWLAPNGDFSLNVAIRTLEFAHVQRTAAPTCFAPAHPHNPIDTAADDTGIHVGRFGVGGGIVYDSRAEQEWQECLWKARVLNLGDKACAIAPFT